MSNASNLEPLRLRLRKALTAAMKAQDAAAVSVLRTTLGAIDNAEAVDGSLPPSSHPGPIAGGVAGLGAGEIARLQLSEQQIADIVQAEAAARQSTAAEYDRLGRPQDAARLRSQAAILVSYLETP